MNPNCSESVARINLKNLTEADKDELIALLERISKDEDHWYYTDWSEDDVFGQPIIAIDGNAPYNEPEWLEEQLRSLKCGKRLEIEWGDS